MGLDRPPAEHQPVGDLGVTEPFGNETEDLDLTSREAGG